MSVVDESLNLFYLYTNRYFLLNLMLLYNLYPDEKYLKSLSVLDLKEAIYVINAMYYNKDNSISGYMKTTNECMFVKVPKKKVIKLKDFYKAQQIKYVSSNDSNIYIMNSGKIMLDRIRFLSVLFNSTTKSTILRKSNLLNIFKYDLVNNNEMTIFQDNEITNEFIHAINLLLDTDFSKKFITILYGLNCKLNNVDQYKLESNSNKFLTLESNVMKSLLGHSKLLNYIDKIQRRYFNDSYYYEFISFLDINNFYEIIMIDIIKFYLKFQYIYDNHITISNNNVFDYLIKTTENQNLKNTLLEYYDSLVTNTKIDYYEISKKCSLFTDCIFGVDILIDL